VWPAVADRRSQDAAVQEAGAGATRRVGDRRSTWRDRPALVRFGPAGTAWDRLGPDKFFSPRTKMSPKSQRQGPRRSFEGMRLSAESRYGWVGSVGRPESWHVMPSGLRLRLRTDKSAQVVDISSRMATSCVATDWFSAPCGENRRFLTHLSPVRGLIYRRLRRFCLIFLQAENAVQGPKSQVQRETAEKSGFLPKAATTALEGKWSRL
jgi:hypothetical protein